MCDRTSQTLRLIRYFLYDAGTCLQFDNPLIGLCLGDLGELETQLRSNLLVHACTTNQNLKLFRLHA